jgi:hypothetical protein
MESKLKNYRHVIMNARNKTDIVATELLGSFSDNELSLEYIDDTWRFSKPTTSI